MWCFDTGQRQDGECHWRETSQRGTWELDKDQQLNDVILLVHREGQSDQDDLLRAVNKSP